MQHYSLSFFFSRCCTSYPNGTASTRPCFFPLLYNKFLVLLLVFYVWVCFYCLCSPSSEHDWGSTCSKQFMLTRFLKVSSTLAIDTILNGVYWEFLLRHRNYSTLKWWLQLVITPQTHSPLLMIPDASLCHEFYPTFIHPNITKARQKKPCMFLVLLSMNERSPWITIMVFQHKLPEQSPWRKVAKMRRVDASRLRG